MSQLAQSMKRLISLVDSMEEKRAIIRLEFDGDNWVASIEAHNRNVKDELADIREHIQALKLAVSKAIDSVAINEDMTRAIRALIKKSHNVVRRGEIMDESATAESPEKAVDTLYEDLREMYKGFLDNLSSSSN